MYYQHIILLGREYGAAVTFQFVNASNVEAAIIKENVCTYRNLIEICFNSLNDIMNIYIHYESYTQIIYICILTLLGRKETSIKNR